MKRNLASVLLTVGLLTSASAFAWIDPGAYENYPQQPQVLTFEQEMRDLRRAFVRERIAAARQAVMTLTFDQEMRVLRAEFRARQHWSAPDVIRLGEALQNPRD